MAPRTTRCRSAARAFTKDERGFKVLFDKSADAQFLMDGNVFVKCNAAALHIMGCTSKEELLRHRPGQFSPPTQPDGRLSEDKAREMVARALETGAHRFTWVHRRMEGVDFPADVALTAVLFDEKLRLHAVVRDVTEREASRRALLESEQKYRDLTEMLPQSVFEMNPGGRITFVNNRGLEHFGYTREEFEKGVWLSQVIIPEDYLRALYNIGRVLESQGSANAEYTAVRKDGSRFPCLVSATPIIEEGTPVGLRGTLTDIAERKRAEEKLAESEERYRTAIEQSSDGVAIVSGDVHVFVNRKFLEMFGYDRPDEILGKSIATVVHPEDREEVMRMNRRRQRGEPTPSTYEIRGVRKDGSTIYLEVSATSVLYRGQAHSFVYLRDITARRKAEEELRKQRETFFTILENDPNGVAVVDKNGTYRYLNPEFTALTGYGLDDVHTGREWFQKAYPDPAYRKNVVDTWKRNQLSPGRHIDVEFTIVRKDGQKRDIEFRTTFLEDFSIIVLHDITERKRAEEQAAASLKEKEALLKEVHHRVKNNLQIVSSMLYLQARKTEHPGAIEALKDSQNRVRSMALIHDRLYRSPSLASVDMEEYARSLVHQIVESYRNGGHPIGLETNIDHVALNISQAIPCGLIINELVSNALKHAFGDGREGQITVQLQKTHEGKIRLTIGDSGVGFPQQVDFRNSPSLGLNLVCTLVQQLEGTIELDTSTGSAFTVTFG